MISSVRLGFATNSSSSHSIVLTNTEYSYKPSYDDFEYGWENFTLVDKDQKLRYLALQIVHDLSRFLSREHAAMVARDILEGHLEMSDYDLKCLVAGYIDHQSAVLFPDFSDPKARERIIRQAIEAFSSKNLVVFGGNDNSDSGHELRPGELSPAFGDTSWCSRLMPRVDGDNVVFFNTNTGAKIRFSPSGSYTKSAYPELVDIKITDYCPYGCAFCYQGSTKGGTDAASDLFPYRVMEELGNMGVFEVALGGGEPTTSARFTGWIEEALRNGVMPNFTTFSVEWLKDEYKLEAARKCRGIGVSVHDIRGLDKVAKITEAVTSKSYEAHSPRVTAQHVVGTLSVPDTAELVREAWKRDMHVLLLGYKTVGFGGKMSPHSMAGLAEAIASMRNNLKSERRYYPMQLSCDTAFVEAHPEFLKANAVPMEMTASPEGAFSCYLDAVSGKMGPSSYCDPELMTPIKGDCFERDFIRNFRTY